MEAQNVAFGIIAAAMGVSAIRVVTTKNVVHAALYLVLVLGGVGMNFILLGAEFTAVTQLIVYIGAVVVLFSDHGARYSLDLRQTEWYHSFLAARTPDHPDLFASEPVPTAILRTLLPIYVHSCADPGCTAPTFPSPAP